MSDVPVYKLTCNSITAADLFAGILRGRGFIATESSQGTISVPYGGGFKGLSEIYELGRDLGVAGDVAWSEFLMQGDRPAGTT